MTSALQAEGRRFDPARAQSEEFKMRPKALNVDYVRRFLKRIEKRVPQLPAGKTSREALLKRMDQRGKFLSDLAGAAAAKSMGWLSTGAQKKLGQAISNYMFARLKIMNEIQLKQRLSGTPFDRDGFNSAVEHKLGDDAGFNSAKKTLSEVMGIELELNKSNRANISSEISRINRIIADALNAERIDL